MKFTPRLAKKTQWKQRFRLARTGTAMVMLPYVLSGCVAMVTGETPAQSAARTAPQAQTDTTNHTSNQPAQAKDTAEPTHTAAGIPLANLTCFEQGRWTAPGDGAAKRAATVFADFADANYVLLGETHDQAEHHRWQLHTAAAIYGRHPNMALGFEMFPRSAQPVLDRWVAGELTEDEFLKQTRWGKVWSYPAEIYMPLFQFARQNRIPMMALNVEHDLVRRVRKEGWDAVPEDQKEGVSRPAAPLPAYRDFLFNIYRDHVVRARHGTAGSQDVPKPGTTETSENDITIKDQGFIRFTESQRTWDRAMAQALIAANRLKNSPLVVGIIGTGHLINGYGVPYQLADLGALNTRVVLPWDGQLGCDRLKPGTADLIFGLPRQMATAMKKKPLLGVMLRQDKDEVAIIRVVDGSVAEVAGLKGDDVVISAAGEAITELSHLISIVQRQAPGTWLPLTVRRNGKTVDLMAKFPSLRKI